MNHVEEQILKSGRRLRGNIVLRRSGDLLFIGGHGPEDEVTGEPFYTGRLGRELTVEDGYKAARICGEILLSAIQEYLGDLDRVDYLVKAFGLVSSELDFYEAAAQAQRKMSVIKVTPQMLAIIRVKQTFTKRND